MCSIRLVHTFEAFSAGLFEECLFLAGVRNVTGIVRDVSHGMYRESGVCYSQLCVLRLIGWVAYLASWIFPYEDGGILGHFDFLPWRDGSKVSGVCCGTWTWELDALTKVFRHWVEEHVDSRHCFRSHVWFAGIERSTKPGSKSAGSN